MSKGVKQVKKYSKSEVMTLFGAFTSMDTDGKGYFREADVEIKSVQYSNEAKLKALKEGWRHSTPQIRVQGREMIRSMDVDGDGKVNWMDMLRTFFPGASKRELAQMHLWAYPVKDAEPEVPFELSKAQLEEIARLFNLNDQNKDGRIDMREFMVYCKDSGYDMEEVESLFAEADLNQDKVISFDEFIEMVKGAYMPLDSNYNESPLSSSSPLMPTSSSSLVVTDRKDDIKDLDNVLGIQPNSSRKKLNHLPSPALKEKKKNKEKIGSGVTEAHKNQRGIVVGISSAPLSTPSRSHGGNRALLPTRHRDFTFLSRPVAVVGPRGPSYMRPRIMSDPGSVYVTRPAQVRLFPLLPSSPPRYLASTASHLSNCRGFRSPGIPPCLSTGRVREFRPEKHVVSAFSRALARAAGQLRKLAREALEPFDGQGR